MKSVFDSSFKYRPSFDTDVRETFSRIRREQQAQIGREQAQIHRAPPTKLTTRPASPLYE
jgi:predicted transposase YbfD/YdcC